MFYETEIRREDEYCISSQVADKELELALLLVNNLVVAFDAAKYRDGYREKLDALIQAKLNARPQTETEPRKPAPVVNILDALRRSLDSNRCESAPQEPTTPKKKRTRTGAKQRSDKEVDATVGVPATGSLGKPGTRAQDCSE
jgi:DNA end-binding protein Ku